MGGSQNKKNKREGTNHPGGVLVNYYLDFEPDSTTRISLKFLDEDGALIREFSNQSKEGKLEPKKGYNQFSWDMRYPDATKFEGLILWAANLKGPVALPGNYQTRLVVLDDSLASPFTIVRDPRSRASGEELKAQFDFHREVSETLSETHEAIIRIREVRSQIDHLKEKISNPTEFSFILKLADTLNSKLSRVEETLYQTKNKSNQDPLNYPIRLNNKLAYLMWLSSVGDYPPTEQALSFRKEVTAGIDAALGKLKEILEKDVPAFNQAVLDAGIQPVMMELD
jgi:hypothetical protein